MIEGMWILGENLNATRKIVRTSKRLVQHDGRAWLRYRDMAGEDAGMDLTEAMEKAEARGDRMLPYIAEGIVRRDARWVQAVTVEQIRAGADFIDLCVDECATTTEERWEHLEWLITTVAAVSGDAALVVDSSDSAAIRQGLDRIVALGRRPMVNSINLEAGRRDLVDDVARTGALVVANASGERGLPTTAEEKIANLAMLQEIMDEAGIPMGDRYLDPLVMPIATDADNGRHLFDATRALRERYPEVHITGGISNVSFGLPRRGIMNNAMLYLFKQAGGDSAIIDPLQIQRFETEDPAFDYAVKALEGEDMCCMEYTMFCRS